MRFNLGKRSYSYTFRLLPFLLMVFGLSLTLSAMFWQWGRAIEEQQKHAQFILLSKQLPKPLTEKSILYQRVFMQGQANYSKACWWEQRQMQGQFGRVLLVPFQLSNGVFVWVNQGWMAAQPGSIPPSALLFAQDKQQLKQGILMPFVGDSSFIEAPAVGFVCPQPVSYSSMQQVLTVPAAKVLPFILQQKNMAADGLLRNWDAPSDTHLKNMNYAGQWLLFSMIIILMYFFISVKTYVP